MTATQQIEDAAQRLFEADSVRASFPFPPWHSADEVTRARYRKRVTDAIRNALPANLDAATAQTDAGLRETVGAVLRKSLQLLVRFGYADEARRIVRAELPPANAPAPASLFLHALVQAELDASDESRHLQDEPLQTALDARELVRDRFPLPSGDNMNAGA